MIVMGVSDIKDEGISSGEIEIQQSLDIRYKGQSYELNVPYSENYKSDFQDAHNFAYGYSYIDKPFEIVNLRVRAIGQVTPIVLPQIPVPIYNNPIPMEHRKVEFFEGSSLIPVYDYGTLLPGSKLVGPALIVSPDTTILIYQNDLLIVDKYQNLIIDVYTENFHRDD
jgi:N-methylhydantoinase A